MAIGTYVGDVLITKLLQRETFFPQGFALAIRKLEKQNRGKPANNTVTAETPRSSSKSSGGLNTK